MVIRKAELKDLENLLSIYNYEVINTAATFDLNPKTIGERKKWFYEHNIGNHPLIVAEMDGQAVGYASLSPYREKEAYSATVELSVYVDVKYRKMGVAGKLMQQILDYAKNDESIHLVLSVITSGNEASVRLHEKFGFTFCGTIPQAGRKFGKYWGIDNYGLIVD